MAAENQSEAVPDFPPSNYGGVGGGGRERGRTRRSPTPLDSPTVELGAQFQPKSAVL